VDSKAKSQLTKCVSFAVLGERRPFETVPQFGTAPWPVNDLNLMVKDCTAELPVLHTLSAQSTSFDQPGVTPPLPISSVAIDTLKAQMQQEMAVALQQKFQQLQMQFSSGL